MILLTFPPPIGGGIIIYLMIGSLISGIASLFGAGLNYYNASRDRRAQIAMFNENMRDNARNRAFQASEAAKQRQFNSAEALLSRNFAQRMADRAFLRNSIGNQLQQMKSAGLNPALAYGNANFQPMGQVESSQASSSASPSGSAGAPSSLNPFGFDAMSVSRQLAEIDAIKAQTKKTESETRGIDKENKWIDLRNQATVDSTNMSVTVGDSVRKLNDAQFNKVTKELQTIELQWDEIRERVALLKTQNAGASLDNELKAIEKRFKTPYMEAVINKISAESGESKFRVFRGMKLLSLEALNLQNDASLKASQSSLNHFLGVKQYQENSVFYETFRGIQLHNEQLELNLESDKTFRSAERKAGIFYDIMAGIGFVLGGASSASSSGLFKGKSRPIGFGK